MNKQEIRRAVIRMALPHDKRQTEEKATSFAVKAARRHELPAAATTGVRR
jgi:hypothetical protein